MIGTWSRLPAKSPRDTPRSRGCWVKTSSFIVTGRARFTASRRREMAKTNARSTPAKSTGFSGRRSGRPLGRSSRSPSSKARSGSSSTAAGSACRPRGSASLRIFSISPTSPSCTPARWVVTIQPKSHAIPWSFARRRPNCGQRAAASTSRKPRRRPASARPSIMTTGFLRHSSRSFTRTAWCSAAART